MGDILDRIDAVADGRCPCGAEPVPGSAYCGPDCEPTHLSEDTDDRESGWLATPMRWRPDLVTAADDTDLIPLGSETHGYTGRFNAQVYERESDPTTWHLRLDDGHRFVGLDLDSVGGRHEPISVELAGRVREAWQRLERELADPRHMVLDGDPWPELIPREHVNMTVQADRVDDQLRLLLNRGAVVTWAQGGPIPPGVGATRDRPSHAFRRSYHTFTSASAAEEVGRSLAEVIQTVSPQMEAFLRQVGIELTGWQRAVLARMSHISVITPRRTGRSPWLSEEVWAALNQPAPTIRRDPPAPPADPDEPPADPMARALWLKRRRNTGPGPDRLDGRRRRRR